MKKVLLVVPTLAQGGGEKFVVDLAKNIDRTKFEVKLLVYYKEKGTILEKDVEENNVDVVYLDKQVGLDFKFFKQVKKFIKACSDEGIETVATVVEGYKDRHIDLERCEKIAANLGAKFRVREWIQGGYQ